MRTRAYTPHRRRRRPCSSVGRADSEGGRVPPGARIALRRARGTPFSAGTGNPNPKSELATVPAMTVGEYAEALAAMTDARCCATRSCRVLNRSSRKPKPDTRPATPASPRSCPSVGSISTPGLPTLTLSGARCGAGPSFQPSWKGSRPGRRTRSDGRPTARAARMMGTLVGMVCSRVQCLLLATRLPFSTSTIISRLQVC